MTTSPQLTATCHEVALRIYTATIHQGLMSGVSGVMRVSGVSTETLYSHVIELSLDNKAFVDKNRLIYQC